MALGNGRRSGGLNVGFQLHSHPDSLEKKEVPKKFVGAHKKRRGKPTDQTQPNWILKPYNSKNSQPNPQPWLRVQRQPKEALIGQILRTGTTGVAAAVLGLEDPVRIARHRVDFIPPPQSHQTPAGDIFEVVEVDREEEDCEDEDKDACGLGD